MELLEKGRQTNSYHDAGVNIAQFNPADKGDTFATGSDDFHIKVWNFKDGKLLNDISGGHDKPIYTLAYNNEGDHLLSGGLDKRILHWDLNKSKKQKLRSHNFSVEALVFSPNYQFFVSTSRDLSWKLWNYNINTPKEIYKIPNGHFSYIMSAAFSPDGKNLITGSFDREIRLWKLENGERLKIFEAAKTDDKKKKSSGSHEKSIVKVAWSISDIIASMDVDGIVKIWTPEGEETKSFNAHKGGNHIEFSFDGSKLVTSGEDGLVHIWDTSSFSKTNSYSADGLNVKIATINSNGTRLVYGDESGRIFMVEI
ncbi:MAG: hypothetical protein HeimC3_11300 [Candidatus Heimdallarchaeota archaeon LC_3]|nr:MAG: hypothetical protein HeimC3_11300 [Candidatus Heimdallarchaeota archaeon LC_3]